MGLGGLIWPRAAEYLAVTAQRHNLPFILSMFATTSLERVIALAPRAWFQLYVPSDRGIERDLIQRAKAAGYGDFSL